ncbi:cytochrome c maturation protein CcmE [Lentisalinibacter salinarum]|uniref:cytochrome c maturation protein CcmE n=1 Tax=Lentisalinibacter salinarum TaxID=2992239 RepID=UPI00386DFAF0
MMTPRRQRMLAVGLAVTGLAIATALSLTAFRENMMFYIELDQVVAGNVPDKRTYRVGGMVKEGTIERESGSMDVEFTITDYQNSLGVRYNGVLPDLFREGQGVIAHGRLGDDGVFQADKILAKHDENYMPPEVADSLKRSGHFPERTTP